MNKTLSVSRPTAFLTRCFFGLLYVLPGILFFSYHPVISLGSSNSMNFELSLPLAWLVLFDLVAFAVLISIAKTRNFGGITDRRFFLLSLIPFYLTISVFWSANPLRGLLTAGIAWLLFFAIFAILSLTPLLISKYQDRYPSIRHYRTIIIAATLVASVIICAVCWLQSFLDILNVNRAQTLLCAGCTYSTFGFPHPSGFAIEPQFMGNLLLAPTLLSLYLLTFRRQSFTKAQSNWILGTALILSTTLFFTFSRGAIYAYIIAIFIMFLLALKLFSSAHRFLVLLIVPIVTFIFSLTMQGTIAALSPTTDTFFSGITKSLHQLSLGVIDLRSSSTKDPSLASDHPTPSPTTSSSEHDTSSTFSGYVPESTNTRLDLNQAALRAWRSSPRSLIFGVGLGGAGTAMHRQVPSAVSSPKEIVQNQYFSLLLEGGLTLLFLVAFVLICLLYPQLKTLFSSHNPRSPAQNSILPLLAPLILAYLVTLNFFSGLPNALQIYLLPPLFYLAFSSVPPSIKKKHKKGL